MNEDVIKDGSGFSVRKSETSDKQQTTVQTTSQKEDGKVCICGKTEPCFRPRCDFPGWHGV